MNGGLHRSGATGRAAGAAKGILDKATAQKDALGSEGMLETLLDDLGAAVEEFEAARVVSRAGRRDHVGARVELEGVTRLLDGLVRYRFTKDGELLAAWASASNVPGPSKAKVVPPSSGSAAPAREGAGVGVRAVWV